MLPDELLYEIFTIYIPLNKIYLINKKYNNYFNNKVNKNIRIIQRFNKRIDITEKEKKILYDDFDNTIIDDYIIQRFWIRTYPKDYIISNIRLSVEKLSPRLDNIVLEKLIKLNKELDMNTDKNVNYFINKYVSILPVDKLLYIGW